MADGRDTASVPYSCPYPPQIDTVRGPTVALAAARRSSHTQWCPRVVRATLCTLYTLHGPLMCAGIAWTRQRQTGRHTLTHLPMQRHGAAATAHASTISGADIRIVCVGSGFIGRGQRNNQHPVTSQSHCRAPPVTRHAHPKCPYATPHNTSPMPILSITLILSTP